MNPAENQEVHDIANRLDRLTTWARWILGIVLAGAVSLAGYGIVNEGRVSTLESSTKSVRGDVDRLQAVVSLAAKEASMRAQDLSRMSAQIEAQSRTLNRIDGSLSELTRYLRDNQGDR